MSAFPMGKRPVQIGDQVVWLSKSRGVGTLYFGKVLWIVPANQSLGTSFWSVFDSKVQTNGGTKNARLYRPVKHALGIGIKKAPRPRTEESYIIRADGQYTIVDGQFNKKNDGAFYFPKVKALRYVGDSVVSLVAMKDEIDFVFGVSVSQEFMPTWVLPSAISEETRVEPKDFFAHLVIHGGFSWMYSGTENKTSMKKEITNEEKKQLEKERRASEIAAKYEYDRQHGGNKSTVIVIAIGLAVFAVARYFQLI